MEKYRQMLRQALTSGLSANRIAAMRGMSHHTVRRWTSIAEQLHLTTEQLDRMTHADLRRMFKTQVVSRNEMREPDWEEEARLVRSGLTRTESYALYTARVGQENALAYRTYCGHLQGYVMTLHPVMRLEHVAGLEMQTDFAGDPVPGREADSCDLVHFKLFVAVLPFSRLVFAYVVRTERVNDHISANIAALEYFGGAPMLTKPDNLKAAIISRPKYGAPRLQDAYQACLDHYSMGCDPARPGRPQDKSSAENSVKIVQRLVRLRLRGAPLLPLIELRKLVAAVVEEVNNRILRRANGHSRRSLFEAEERSCLRPLPAERFQVFDMTTLRSVHRDYHVEFKGNYYSVPHMHIGTTATVKASPESIEILVDGQVVALHPRSHRQGQTITDPSHRPENHAAMLAWNLIEWSSKFGDACVRLAEEEVAKTRPNQRRARERWIMSLPGSAPRGGV